MLNMHEKKSRGRMLAGAATIAALTVGALGLTASGTQAAERVRTKVEKTIGVDLARVEIPAFPVFQEVPPVPPMPETTPPPPAPDAAPVVKKNVRIIMRDKDGKVTQFNGEDLPESGYPEGKIRMHRVVMRDKDGKMTTREFAMPPMPPEALARLKDMPEISSRNCTVRDGDDDGATVETRDGKTRKIVICTDRIQRHAARAAQAAAEIASVDVVRIQGHAMNAAREGLRAARRSIQDNKSMTDTQRSAALEGIDEAIREMSDKSND